MKTLGVKCRDCGRLFGIGIGVATYGRPHLAPFACTCPSGHRAEYASDDCEVIG